MVLQSFKQSGETLVVLGRGAIASAAAAMRQATSNQLKTL
jgi:hypothetical protein